MIISNSLVLFLCSLTTVSSYNFLVYNPLFGHSHATFFNKIADALTEAGHNVTVLMPICDKRLVDKVGLKSTKDVIMIANAFGDIFATTCRDVFENKEILQKLKEKKFDAGISEAFHLCGLGLLEYLEIPAIIGASSGTNLDAISRMIGQPVVPSFVPGSTSTFSDKMTLSGRAINAISTLVEGVFFNTIYGKDHAVLKEKIGKDFYSIEVLISRISFNLVNSNPYLDFPLPVIQKTVAIGGISVNFKANHTLDEYWKNILKLRPNTVLISFGSVAQSCKMPDRYKLGPEWAVKKILNLAYNRKGRTCLEADPFPKLVLAIQILFNHKTSSLLEVFKSMPETTFIWKYESDDVSFASHLNDLVLSKWVPQSALLADPRLSFFVTHGGLGSVNELAHLGKKALVIPLFGDQPHNSQMLARHGGAELLTKFDLAKPKVIREAFEKLLSTESYSKNAERLAEMLQNQPISAKELLVKHCEFAARFGKLPNLDPQGRHLSFVQYFLIDVIACAITFILIILITLFIIVKKCLNRFSKIKKE